METLDLSISHDECKAKANEVASLVLAEYAAEESNNIFSLRGRTSSSRVLLVCMKKNRGVHFVLITTSNNFESEFKTILDRIEKFMKS